MKTAIRWYTNLFQVRRQRDVLKLEAKSCHGAKVPDALNKNGVQADIVILVENMKGQKNGKIAAWGVPCEFDDITD